MKTRVGIIGATGYGGGELLRLLLRHAQTEVVFATSRTESGKPVGAVHRNLDGLADLTFSAPSEDELVAGTDVIFGALPHGASAATLTPLVERGARVIDLSGDFRLRDAAAYKLHYKKDHPHPHMLGRATYGCPELNREALRDTRFVAAPGCFATAINLALLPAATAGLLKGCAVHVTGMTGSSGSGADASEGTHHPTRAGTMRPYKVLDHQHVPEITQLLGDAGGAPQAIHFTPVSAPIVRGILVIATAVLAAPTTTEALNAIYQAHYRDAAFVKVLTHREPECATIATTNFAEVRVRANGGLLHVACSLDNLVKGGAGQAVQCMNLMMGFPESAGLDWPGTWP